MAVATQRAINPRPDKRLDEGTRPEVTAPRGGRSPSGGTRRHHLLHFYSSSRNFSLSVDYTCGDVFYFYLRQYIHTQARPCVHLSAYLCAFVLIRCVFGCFSNIIRLWCSRLPPEGTLWACVFCLRQRIAFFIAFLPLRGRGREAKEAGKRNAELNPVFPAYVCFSPAMERVWNCFIVLIFFQRHIKDIIVKECLRIRPSSAFCCLVLPLTIIR